MMRFARVGMAVAGLMAGPWAGAESVLDGKWSLDARYRVESVDQDNALDSAVASTLRTRAGFETNTRMMFGAKVEVEDVHAIGGEEFNSTTNGHTRYSVVPDPNTTELNQAYLSARRSGFSARLGRQAINLDNARFIGDVNFRQNQQTFDAITLQATTPGGSRFIYDYLWKAHRIFGDDHPLGELGMRTHALNYSLGRLNGDRLTAYGYLLEFEKAALQGSSTQTFGLSYDGGKDLSSTRRFLYRAEYAYQSDYADNPHNMHSWYGNLEVGLRFANQWVATAGAELLSGDGASSFQTPLGTLHKFNGFADVFVEATPADGLEDRYLRLYMPVSAARFVVTLHDFRSDNGSRDFGTEVDAEVNWRLTSNWLVGAKYADYNADGFSVDTRKAWLFVEANF
jgi:alginate export protein